MTIMMMIGFGAPHDGDLLVELLEAKHHRRLAEDFNRNVASLQLTFVDLRMRNRGVQIQDYNVGRKYNVGDFQL